MKKAGHMLVGFFARRRCFSRKVRLTLEYGYGETIVPALVDVPRKEDTAAALNYRGVETFRFGEGTLVATIKDVARLAGVSISTASVALSGKGPVSEATQLRVREAARRLRYRPNAIARSLVTRRTRSIGLVLADLTDPYFHGIAKGVEGVVSEAGYTVVLADTDRSAHKEERSIDTLVSHQVDGLIVAGSGDGSEGRLERLHDLDTPIVVVGSYEVNVPSVTVDNEGAGATVTQHLLDEGYHRIGYINGPNDLLVSHERYSGFRRVLETHSLSPARYAEGDFTPAGGYLAAKRLIETDGPTRMDAILAANDQMAIGALKAVREAGVLIPNQIAVAGIGDIPNAVYVDPPLTTVSLPLKELGRTAADVLLQLIDGRQAPSRPITLGVTLNVRASSKRSSNREERMFNVER